MQKIHILTGGCCVLTDHCGHAQALEDKQSGLATEVFGGGVIK